MAETTITKVSTKGQVVIPKELRKEMKIRVSDEFLIYGERDTIIMKKVARSSLKKRFQKLSKQLGGEMRVRGVRRKDVARAVGAVRGSRQ